jgi:outer membrane immunogenic protein
MRKSLLAAVSLTAMTGVALAADLPSRKSPPVAPPLLSWSGVYAGLNAGYNFGTNSNVLSQNVGTPWTYAYNGVPSSQSAGPIAMNGNASNTQSGFIGGAQVGYNYQWGSSLVLGFEADIQGAGIRGASQSVGFAAFGALNNSEGSSTASGSTAVQGGVDYLGTARARIGFLATPTLMIFGTGGLAYGGAWANVAQSATDLLNSEGAGTAVWIGGGRQSQLLTGWTVGGGVEWMFTPNWSLKGEASYWDLGRMNVQTTAIGVSPSPVQVANGLGAGRTSVAFSGVQAKLGVNYHFNWGSDVVVAKF